MGTIRAARAFGRTRARLHSVRVSGDRMGRSSPGWCALAVGTALAFPACDPPAPEPQPAEPQTAGVTIRDSAGIQIVENHAPVWDSTNFWTVDPEPEYVLGGLGPPGDSAHLIWRVRQAAPLSDGRVAMLAPMSDRKVLVFEPSGELSAAFGRAGRGPGEFHYPMHLQVLPGDTIVVWDQMFRTVPYFDPSGRLLRERRIDLGAVVAAARTGDQRPGESVHRPLPDGSFLIKVTRLDWEPPAEAGVIYRRPTGYVRIDSAYSAHSFGWWGDYERLWWPDQSVARMVPFPAGSTTVAGGDPLSIYITDGDRFEIHQFSAMGALQRIIRRTVDPLPATDDDLEEWKELAASVYPNLNWRRWERETDGRLTGRHFAAIIALRVDPSGYLWAYDSGRREWSVFNAGGRWLGTVALPDIGVAWIGADAVVGSSSDPATGVQTVERYRLNRSGSR